MTATPINSVESANSNTGTNTSLVVTLASAAAGDLNVIQISAHSAVVAGVNVGLVTPAGWTKVFEQFATGTPSVVTCLYYRAYQAGDGSTATFAFTNQGQAMAVCTSFSVGTFDAATPISYYAGVIKPVNNSTYAVAGTTTAAGCLFYGAANKSGALFTGMPGGDTVILNDFHAGAMSMVSAYQTPDTPAGSSYSKTFTGASSSVGTQWAFVVTSATGSPPPPSTGDGIQELIGLGNVTGNVSQSNLVTGQKPLNTSDGDLLIARVTAQTSNGNISESGSSAWTAIGPAIPATSLRPQRMYILPVPSAAALTATSWNWAGSLTGRMNVQINRITGIDLASVVEVEGAWSNGGLGATGTFALPGFTTTDANNLLVAHIHSVNTSAQGNLVYTPPPGFTETSRTDSVPSGTASNDTSVGFSMLTTAAGSVPAQTVTVTSAVSAVNGVMVALNVKANLIARTAVDQVGVTDGFTAAFAGGTTKSPGDSVGISDTFTTQSGRAVTINDNVGITDRGAASAVTRWFGAQPAEIGHRDGFSATLGEFTVAGFNALKARNPSTAWNIDVWKTSDGEWVASHDQTTGRVLSGTSLDIPTSTWASISGKTTLVGGQPVARLADIVAIANPDTVYFLDNKQSQNIPTLISYLASLGLTPANTVMKTYAGSGGSVVQIYRDAGFQQWLYAFDADLPALANNVIVDPTAWIGFDYQAPQASWDTVVAMGHPVTAHILGNPAHKATADAKVAAAGGRNAAYMVTDIPAVIAPDVIKDAVGVTDISSVIRAATGQVNSDDLVRITDLLVGEVTSARTPNDPVSLSDLLTAVFERPPVPALTPDPPSECWPVDTSFCADWADYPAPVQAIAEDMAVQTLRHLTAYRIGGCPITVRPCWDATACCVTMAPVIVDGQWYNSHCPGACDPVCVLVLPPPVNQLVEVTIDGVVVDAGMYRVDNGNELVWLGEGCGWPVGQDMTVSPSDPGSFAVTYLQGAPVDTLASFMAGVLACEYAKAMTGAKGCRLPAGVTSVTRQGVSYNMANMSPQVASMFPGGITGLPEVDNWIRMWNPLGVTSPSVIWAPDQPTMRVTTWPR